MKIHPHLNLAVHQIVSYVAIHICLGSHLSNLLSVFSLGLKFKHKELNIAVNCFFDKESNIDFTFVFLAFPLYFSQQFWDL